MPSATGRGLGLSLALASLEAAAASGFVVAAGKRETGFTLIGTFFVIPPSATVYGSRMNTMS